MSRVIKKYSNRRLYDTEESRYIKIADVRQLVLDGIDFLVVDQKSGDDVTRSILLRVISEQEQNGDAIMSIAFLNQVIRAHGNSAPAYLARHLERSLTSWLVSQNQLLGQISRAVSSD